jgi:hypothetical protein
MCPEIPCWPFFGADMRVETGESEMGGAFVMGHFV